MKHILYRGKKIILFFGILLLGMTTFSFVCYAELIKSNEDCPYHKNSPDVPKVLYIDSYHPEYVWSQEVEKGIRNVLEVSSLDYAHYDDSQSPVCFKAVHMDTKRNKEEEDIQAAALEVKKIIDRWQPDLVIVSDDNAAKYVVVPYLKDTSIPVVFCGINWDCSSYGFPAENITGMVEVHLVPQVLGILEKYASGRRIGYMASNNITERKNATNIAKYFEIDLDTRLANDFDDFKHKYLLFQKEVDILLLSEFQSLPGFDPREAIDFVQRNTAIPSGALFTFMAPYVVVTCASTGVEQGEWAARTALRILGGDSPSDIPVAKNKKAKIYLNMTLAKRLQIKFPMDLIERSTFVEEEKIE
jgi:hypothetical protein